MSFRIEEKLFITNESLLDFKSFLNKQHAKTLYDSRVVQSLYFENLNYDIFKDSLEGIVPRKKIRIRNYPLDKKKLYFFETKISSVEGRFKKKRQINIDEIKKYKNYGIYDTQYGVCYPKLYVNFLREYYLIDDNLRLTIDKDIKFQKYNTNYTKSDNNIIVELKAPMKVDTDLIAKKFSMKKTRFSKYCNGIELLKIDTK